MDGAAMAIEALGAIIMKKDKELEMQKQTIDELNKRIEIFKQYIEVYEEWLKKEEV